MDKFWGGLRVRTAGPETSAEQLPLIFPAQILGRFVPDVSGSHANERASITEPRRNRLHISVADLLSHVGYVNFLFLPFLFFLFLTFYFYFLFLFLLFVLHFFILFSFICFT
jgi:hypothetical protein